MKIFKRKNICFLVGIIAILIAVFSCIKKFDFNIFEVLGRNDFYAGATASSVAKEATWINAENGVINPYLFIENATSNDMVKTLQVTLHYPYSKFVGASFKRNGIDTPISSYGSVNADASGETVISFNVNFLKFVYSDHSIQRLNVQFDDLEVPLDYEVLPAAINGDWSVLGGFRATDSTQNYVVKTISFDVVKPSKFDELAANVGNGSIFNVGVVRDGNEDLSSYPSVLIVKESSSDYRFVSKTKIASGNSLRNAFNGYKAVTEINFNGNLDTTFCETFYATFNDCNAVVSLDLYGFDTSKATDMSYMFKGCSTLKYLDLSEFDTSNVNSFSYMFDSCTSLVTVVSEGFDLTSHTSSINMFYNCYALEGAIPYAADCLGAGYANPTTGYFTHIGVKVVSERNGIINPCAISARASDTDPYRNITVDVSYPYSKFTGVSIPGLSGNFYSASAKENGNTRITLNYKFINNVYNFNGNKTITVSFSDKTVTDNLTVYGDRLSHNFATMLKLKPLSATSINTNVTTINFISDIATFDGLIIDNSKVYSVSDHGNIKGQLIDDNGNVTVNIVSRGEIPLRNSNGLFGYFTNLRDINFKSYVTTHYLLTGFALFREDSNLTSIDLSYFDTSRITDMRNMFYLCKNLTSLDLSSFNTSNVTNMQGMFYNCISLNDFDVSVFNTTKTTDMSHMFDGCSSLTSMDLSNFDTRNVINMTNMFASTGLQTIYSPGFNLTNVTDSSNMFLNSTSLNGAINYDSNKVDATYANPITGYFAIRSFGTLPQTWLEDIGIERASGSNLNNVKTINFYVNATAFAQLDASSSDVYPLDDGKIKVYSHSNILDVYSKETILFPTNSSKLFSYLGNVTSINFNHAVNTTDVTDMSSMFSGDTELVSLKLSMFDASNVTNTTSMFENCTKMVSLELPDFSSGSLRDTYKMFYYNSNLTSLDISKINTTNVIRLAYMFNHLDKLQSLDVSNMNTSNVTGFSYLFANDYALQNITGIDNWNTSKVTKMQYMFNKCYKLQSLNFTSWNTSKVTNMAYMFSECRTLTDLNLSNFNTSNVKTFQLMFYKNYSLTSLKIDQFNTTSATNMSLMFAHDINIPTLNLTGWVTDNVTELRSTFANCTSLSKIYAEGFNTTKVTNSSLMFLNCTSLSGIISYDENKIDDNYANPFDGYFTSIVKYDRKIGGIINPYLFAANSSDPDALSIYVDIDYTTSKFVSYTFMGVTENATKHSSNSENLVIELPASFTRLIHNEYNGLYPITFTFTDKVIKSHIPIYPAELSQTWAIEGKYKRVVSGTNTTVNTINFIADRYLFNNYTIDNTTVFDVSGNENVILYKEGSVANIISRTNISLPGNCANIFSGFSSLTNFNNQNVLFAKNVVNAAKMFSDDTKLVSLNLSMLDASHVTNTTSMFENCKQLVSLELPDFSSGSLKDTSRMFFYNSNLTSLDISKLNTTNVINMRYMFYHLDKLKSLDVSNMNTSSATDFQSLFAYDYALKNITGIENWNTSQVTTMSSMFSGCRSIVSLDLSSFNTAKVKSFSYTFYNLTSISELDVSNFNTSAATNMTSMFERCSRLVSLDLSNFNTTIVTSMSYMFKGCSNLTSLNLTNFSTSKVTSMSYMFYGCSRLVSLDLSNFNTSNVTSMSYMFYDCSNLTNLDINNFNTTKVIDMSYMFNGCSNLTNLDISNFNTSNVNNMSGMFRSCSGLVSLDLSNFNTSKVNNMYAMFCRCSNLTSLNLSSFNTNKVNNMQQMFESCSGLVSLDLSNFNTSIVSSMYSMFDGCSNLTNLDISNFNTTIVTSMSYMFYGCSNLTSLNLSSFNTNKVTSMSYMFDGCSGLVSLDLSNFNTSNVTSMAYMFDGCSNLTNLDIRNFNTSKVTSMLNMFDGCSGLVSLDLTSFNTSKVTSMSGMFEGCSGLVNLDLSNFNTSNVTSMSYMFDGCSNLTNLDISNFNTTKVSSIKNLFNACSNLTSLDLSTKNFSKVSLSSVTFYDNAFSASGLKYIYLSDSAVPIARRTLSTDDWWDMNTGIKYTKSTLPNGAGNYTSLVYTISYVDSNTHSVIASDNVTKNGSDYILRDSLSIVKESDTSKGNVTFILNGGNRDGNTSNINMEFNHTINYTLDHYNDGVNNYNPGYVISNVSQNYTFNVIFNETFNSAGVVSTPNGVTRDGYNLVGWNTDSEAANGINGEFYPDRNNITLYAIWSPKQYTITFNGNTGGTPSPTSKSVIYASVYGDLATVSKTGYNFDGWYTKASGGNKITSSTTVGITANQTLYAHWSAKTFTVTFNSTGGTEASYTKTETYDSNYVLPSSPTKTGYTFGGWFTAASGGTEVTTSTKVQLSTNQTLYAHWSQNNYTVTYEKNGGTSTNANKIVTYHKAYGTLDTPTKTGYTFGGWYKEEGFTNAVTSTTNVTTASNHNIYAKWTANKYEVTFNSTGGTPEISKLNETYDSNYVLPSNPTRSGYTFAGWFTSASGGTEVTTSTKVQITGVQTLYAHWTTNSYTLTFDGNGATPSFASKSVAYGSTIGTLPTISKYGYNLASWKIDSNVINETTIYNYTGAKTATANWAAKSVQISYKYLNGDTTTVSTKNINFGSPYILENGSKTGYTFNGWYLDSGLTNKITNGTTLVANETNHNVYSKYTPNTYVVTFNSTGGTSASYTKNETYDSNYVLPSNPTKVGYTFAGWWTQASGGTQVTTSTVVKITSATTLYAHWNANGYTVTFNSTGGSTPDPASKSVTYASTYGTLPTVTKTGHTFSGWYTQASGGTKITSSSTVSITNNQTLYAQWSANNYTVTFNGNTGGTPSPTSKIVTYASVYGELATVSKTGYNFDGWYTKASGGNKITSSTTVGITANQTLYAHWSAKTFTVTFNSTGGTEASYTKTETYDANYTLPSSPTKTGYTFGGWFTAASGGTEVTTSTKVQLSTNQTLYAHWSANTYTVTFNGNNGGTPSPTSKNVTYASTYGDLATVSRTGYDFAGWWTLASGGNQVTSSTPVSITANQTLYAHWSAKTFTVTFNSTGGTEASYTKSETYDANYTLPSSPTRSGYTFAGWFTAVSGGTEVTTSTKMTTAGAHTLYAHWSANGYTVTYNANGGTTANVNKPITYGEAYGTLDTPTRSGYTFVNWYKESSFTNVVNSATIVSDPNSHTIYAKWSANKYEVTFDPNGGSPSSKINETYDSNYALPSSNPTLNGYTFKGWYTAASGGSKVTASTNMTTASAHTLYARWSANNYTVTYNATGGTVSPANKTVTYHSAYGTLATPSRTGYTFKGWYKESGYTNVVNSTTNVTTASNHNIYAKWSANNYTVTLDMNMTGLTNSSITVTYDKAYNYYGALASPSKSGYTFGGWYDGDTRITGTEIYNKASNSVLHARWTQNTYTVTYNATGGTVSPASKTVTYHNTYGTLATPSKTGYTFKGWYKESTFTNKVESSTNVTTASNHNIYAKWSANNYTVTLDMNMTGLTNSSITVTYDKAYNYYGALASPSKSGYTFGGWYDGDTRITGTEIYNKDSNSVLHARWTQNTYTVTYNATGGTVSPTNITVTFNNAYGTLATPSRTGYTFNGWYKESGYTNKIESTTIVSTASNHNIYAKWTANNYTVTLNSNMTGVSDSVITVTYDKAYNYYGALPKPTKTGFTFLGWYDEDTNISGTEIYRKSSNSILNGRWSANSYTLTYNATGGEVSPTSKSITFNSTYGTLATPSRTGYTFKGWFNSTSYTNEIKSDTLVSKAESHTIYAKWSANQYTVTLDADGGSAEISSVTATYDSVYPNLGRAMKSGYTFVGWYDGSTNITSTTVYKTAGAKTLKAHYEANGYTVTYNATGGEVSPQSKGIVFNSTYGELATPSRSGYSFENWYKEIGYVNVVTSTTRVTDSNSHYLYAKWIPKVYTVTFDADGGVADMNNKTVTFDANYGTLASANKTGYTFDGWYDGSSKVTSTTKYRTEGNTTLKARWTAKTYTVTYKYKNADTNETDTKTVTYNGTYGSLITPVKRGYTFLGWYKESTFSNKVTSSTKVTTPNNHDLYSKFTANQYTVTFNYNGGSGNEGSRLVNYDGTYGTLPTANRTGYTFDGWFDENDIEVLSSTVYKVDSNSTLKAKWSVNQYTVTFKYTNGDLNTTASKVVTYNKTYGTLESSSKIGYTFGGWYLENNHTTLVTDSTIVATPNNHDLYSKFTANQYTVTFDAAGGTSSEASRSIKYDAKYGNLPTASKTGYTFIGWFDSSDNQITNNTVYKTTGNTILTAHYSVNSYTVTLNPGAGSVSPGTITVTYYQNYGTIPTPSKSGYTFEGWYRESSFNNKVSASTNMTTSSDHTLYANYVPNDYLVTFDPKGGSANKQNKTVTYDKAYGELATVSKTGYTFLGWYDGSTQVTNNTIYRNAYNTTLDAKWSANSYNVTFKYIYPNNSTTSTKVVTYDSAYGTLPNAERSGYTFNGWYKENTYVNKVESSTIVNTNGAHDLYSKFSANQYTVTFNYDGGSGNKNNMTVTYDQAYGELATASKTGYTFLGWYDGETEVSSASIYRTAGNKTLKARWSADQYTLTYKYLDADLNTTGTKGITFNAAYGTLANAVKRGYTFNGWYLENTYVNQITASSIVNIDRSHDVYSKFTPNVYNVSFNANNGGTNPGAQNVTFDSTYGSLPSVSKTGYTFDGWYDNGTKVSASTVYKNNYNTTLEAKWINNNYTITYKYTDGVSATSTKTVTYHKTYGELASASRTGYTFNGWYLDTTLNNRIYSTSNVTTSSNHNLYSKFTPNNYTVTYNANGGSASANNKTVTYDSAYGTLASATRSGYTFLGWYDGANKVTESTVYKTAGDKTLIAHWSSNNYTVTFMYTNGVNATSSKTVTYHQLYGELANASRTGYTFGGWYLNSDLSNRVYNSTNVTTANNHNLYSKFTPNVYTVTFDPNGGTSSLNSKSVTYDSPYGEMPSASRAGYNFVGWFDGETNVTSITTYKTASNKTLIAHWENSKYTLTYEYVNADTNTTDSKTITYNKTYGSLANATKRGYTFNGWYFDNVTFNNKVEESSIVNRTYSHSVYSKFTANTYTINFNANGGSVSPSSKTVVFDSAFGSLPTPVWSGHSFTGWGYNDTIYEQSDIYKYDRNITLVAQWDVNHYKVTLDDNYPGGSSRNVTVTYGQSYSLGTTSRTGYTFTGWYEGDVKINSIGNYTWAEDKHFDAHYNPNNYVVTLNPNSGDVTPNTVTVTYDSSYANLPSPVRSGYTFAGWYKENTFVNKIENSTIVKTASGHTLYAKWDVNSYNVTFRYKNADTLETENKVVTYDSPYGSLLTPVKRGYSFAGWYKEDTFVNRVYSNTTVKTASDHDLYSKFTVNNYTISYKANGGSPVPGNRNITYDTDYATLPVISKTGYTFNGWYDNGIKVSTSTRFLNDYDTELEARWSANNYTVTFDSDGGSTPESSRIIAYDSAYGTLPVPSKTGRTFAGWFDNGTEVIYSTIYKHTNNITLVAQWTDVGYTVTFKYVDDDEKVTSTKNVAYGRKYGALPNGTKVGYTFMGWFKESSYENLVTEDTIVDVAGSHELYSLYRANEYTISFNPNGGYYVANRTIIYDTLYGVLTPTSKSGYTFIGWYDGEDNITPDTEYKNPYNTTLNAHYVQNNYTVTLNSMGGNCNISLFNVTYDEHYGYIPDPVRSGYTFMGWYDSTGWINRVTSETTVRTASDHTLYAKWSANTYTVTFDGNQGSVSQNNKTVIYDEVYGSLATATRNGYTFKGWFDGSKNITASTNYTNAYDTTLVAHFEANNYTVTYKYIDGVSATSTKKVTYDKAYGTLYEAVRRGYTFNGWYLENTYEHKVTNETIVKTYSNHDLYSKFSVNSYNITFDYKGGHGSKNSMIATFDDAYSDLPGASRTGYTFLGWYDNGTLVNNSTIYKNDYDTTLEARWSANDYGVTFKYKNADTNETAYKSVVFNSTYGTLSNATKIGYTFENWYLEDTFNNVITSESIVLTPNSHDLYSKFIPNNYTISFNYNGGVIGEVSRNITFDSKYNSLPSTERSGYTFLGWYDRETRVSVLTTYKNPHNTTLIAKWDDNDYTVTFKYVDADNNITNTKGVTYDRAYGELYNAVKTGYTFAGWYKESTYVNRVNDNTTVKSAGNHDLYSKFTPNNYTVTFDYNEGSGSEASRVVTYDNKYGILPVASRVGHTFVGWYDGSTNVTKDTIYKTVGDKTLVAHYEANNYTVTLNPLEGSVTPNHITVTYGQDYGLIPDAERSGYTFNDWYKEGTFINKVNATTNVTTASGHTLYAKYSANSYTVTFDYNGGAQGISNKTVIYDSGYDVLPNTSKVGYTFIGWYDGSDKVTSSTIYKNAYNTTLTAHYTKNKYVVTLNPLDGSVVNNKKNVTFDEPYGYLENASRIGYTFDNWYKEETFDNVINSTIVVKTASNHTLYANYINNNYTVTFDYRGGSGNVSSKTVTFDMAYGDLPECTREGYTFKGWYDGSNLVNNETIYHTDGNITLKAHYAGNDYTVTYKYIDADANITSTKLVTFSEEYGTLLNATKNGYIFKGWYKESTFVNKVNESSIVNIASNHDLYSKFTPNTYKISYNPNGGNYTPEERDIVFDSAYGSLPSISRIGYIFKGWYDGSTNISVDSIYKNSHNTTLVAEWEANNYTITYKYKNDDIHETDTKVVTFNSTYGELLTGQKTGYAFGNWYLDSELSNKVTASTKVLTASDHDLYAKWNPKNYALIFNYNGGSGAIVEKTVTFDSSFGELPTPERSGYTFTNWYDEDVIVNSGTIYRTPYNKVIDAHYYANNYTVYFDGEGGSVDTVSKTVTYDSAYGSLPVPVKTGRTFYGWADGDDIVTEETIYKNASNTTLHAIWNDNIYTVTYKYIDADNNSTSTKNVYFGRGYGDLLNAQKRGYSFVGWFLEETFENEITKNTIVNTDCDHDLYSKFVQNNYTITFDANGGELEAYSMNITYDEMIGNLPVVARVGYEFVGWYINNEEINNETIYKIDNNSIAIAKWKNNQYNLMFNALEGDCDILSKIITYDMPYGDMPSANRTGYTFDGWYAENTFVNNITNETIVNTLIDQTVFAKYNINTYKITLKQNNGNSDIEKYVNYNSSINDLPSLNKVGHTFVGWYSDEYFTKQIKNGYIYEWTNDINLYAKYEVNKQVISFEGLNNTNETEVKTELVNYGTVFEVVNVTKEEKNETVVIKFNTAGGDEVETKNSTKTTSYIFSNMTNNDKTYSKGEKFIVTGDIKITVNFDEEVTYQQIELPKEVKKEGYVFLGWKESPESDVIFTDTYIPNGKDVNLYAAYERAYSYEVISGDNSIVDSNNYKDDSSNITYVIDGDYNKFVTLSIDDVILQKEVDYNIYEGSTVIVFTKIGLNKIYSLERGSHNLVATYSNNMSVNMKIIVEKSYMWILWLAIVITIILGIVIYIKYKKKKA